MVEFLRRLSRFLTTMDAKAATSLFVSAVLVVFVLVMLAFGQRMIDVDDGRLGRILLAVSESPWAVLGVVSIFAFLALTGFPQILLITATVLAFGPWDGAIYSWIATMASATLTFGIGHMVGGSWVTRIGGERAAGLIAFLGRHGILASALIRVIPSAPFIVVNAAAGAAHIPLWKYWAGSGVGIVPKIALVATLGAVTPDRSSLEQGVQGVVDFFTSREPRAFALVAAVVGAWLAFLLAMRWLYGRLRRREEAEAAAKISATGRESR